MNKNFVIDERFLGLDKFEQAMYQNYLTIRKEISTTVINHTNNIAKIRFVMAYHLQQIAKNEFNKKKADRKLSKRSTDAIMNVYQKIQDALLSYPELDQFINF